MRKDKLPTFCMTSHEKISIRMHGVLELVHSQIWWWMNVCNYGVTWKSHTNIKINLSHWTGPFDTYFWNHLNNGGGLPSATHSNAAGVNSGAVVKRSGPADNILGESEILQQSWFDVNLNFWHWLKEEEKNGIHSSWCCVHKTALIMWREECSYRRHNVMTHHST